MLVAEPRLRPATWGRPVVSKHLDNWYKLDDKLYRASQPDLEGFQDAARFGIKSVLNLRDNHSDDSKAKGLPLKVHRVEMEADDVIEVDVIKALQIIKESDGPVLVHCWHGSDRTGLVCAMYRITFQNWTKEAAIDEMINGGYGYHKIYKNLPEWIQSVDVPQFRKKVLAK